EVAEAAAEGDVLLRRDGLAAGHDHRVVEQGAMDGGEILVVERPREVGPAHLRAQRLAQPTYLDGHLRLAAPAVAGLYSTAAGPAQGPPRALRGGPPRHT